MHFLERIYVEITFSDLEIKVMVWEVPGCRYLCIAKIASRST